MKALENFPGFVANIYSEEIQLGFLKKKILRGYQKGFLKIFSRFRNKILDKFLDKLSKKKVVESMT